MRLSVAVLAVVWVLGACGPAIAAVRFVKFDATGASNGTSWANAYTTLLSARLAAQPGDEIWVARGTYKTTTPGVPDPRTVAHGLKTGVSILGGFAGTETSRSQRNPRLNVTILSGDVNGDDTPNFGNRSDNAFHVVTAINVGGSLDGFIIQGGQADSTGDNAFGGGIFFRNSNASVSNCIFRDNFAGRGGALASRSGSPTAFQCLFIENRGGSVGAIDVQVSGSTLSIFNCTIASNFTNFPNGAAVSFLNTGSTGNLVEGTILWGNTNLSGSGQNAQIFRSNANGLVVRNTNIQGGTVGFDSSCFSADPLYVSPLGVDGLPNTGDEDFRIGAGSPCIDRLAAGNVWPDVLDDDGDSNTTEPAPFDLNREKRNYDDPLTSNATGVTFDVGAYEYQGIPCPGDMNNDLVVNTLDLTLFLSVFGTATTPSGPGDFTGDGTINTADLVILVGQFGVPCA